MSRLNWDETGERKYENGISHGVLYTRGSEKAEEFFTKLTSAGISGMMRLSSSNVDNEKFNGHWVIYFVSGEEIETNAEPDYPEKYWCTEEEVGGVKTYSYAQIVFSATDSDFISYAGEMGMKDGKLSEFSEVLSPLGELSSVTFSRTQNGVRFDLIFVNGYDASQFSNYSKRFRFVASAFDPEETVFGFCDGTRRAVPDGQPYSFGHVWNGLISVSENPDGAEANDMWADNMKYSSPRSKESFGMTIEAYTYPDEFVVCDGSVEPVEGIMVGQQKRMPFDFCYRTEVGEGSSLDNENDYLLHLVYNCTASPSDRDYETINDSPDAITFSWDAESTPINFEDSDFGSFAPVSKITIDATRMNGSVSHIGNRSFISGMENLARLESILYGTDGTVSVMPSPDIVLKCFEFNSTPEPEVPVDGPVDVEIPDP